MFKEINNDSLDLATAVEVTFRYTIHNRGEEEITVLKKACRYAGPENLLKKSFFLGNNHDIQVEIVNVKGKNVILEFNSYNEKMEETFSIPLEKTYNGNNKQIVIKKGETISLNKPITKDMKILYLSKSYSIGVIEIRFGEFLDT